MAKGADGWGVARDGMVGAALGLFAGASVFVGVQAVNLLNPFFNRAMAVGGMNLANLIPGMNLANLGALLGGGIVMVPGVSSLFFEVVGITEKETDTGAGGRQIAGLIMPLRDDLVGAFGKLNQADRQAVMNLVDGLDGFWDAIGSWDVSQLSGRSKAKCAAQIPNGLNGTLTYVDRVFAVAEVNYTFFGLLQHVAHDANINRALTSFRASLMIATLYRVVAGGAMNLVMWNNEGWNSRRYETATGKVAFVDHGYRIPLVGAFGWIRPPVEASLSMKAMPTNVPFQGPLSFVAGPNPGNQGNILHN